MRAETLNLDLDGSRVGIIIEGASDLGMLREALAEHLVDSSAPIGFRISAPNRPRHYYVLMDRSGFVLGRSRSIDECIGMLASHLAAFLEPPADTVRLRMRALITAESRAVLAGFPLFTTPPVTERRLERTPYRLIDRIAVDADREGNLGLAPLPWPTLAGLPIPGGHANFGSSPAQIDAVLVPTGHNEETSRAAAVVFLAEAGSPHLSIEERVDFADVLTERRQLIPVTVQDRSTRYRVLNELGRSPTSQRLR